MRTAEEIILEIKELPPEEVQKIEEYLYHEREECELSPEELEEVNRRAAEADRGENLSPVFDTVEEALEWLHQEDEEL